MNYIVVTIKWEIEGEYMPNTYAWRPWGITYLTYNCTG